MTYIQIITRIIESLENYYLEKENIDSNVYIFHQNITKIYKEAFYEQIFKQINRMKFLLLALLNIFLLIFLICRISKFDKKNYNSLISILILIALIISLPMLIMMMRLFNTNKIRKKYLLYFLFGINLFLVSLVFYLEFRTINIDTLKNSTNLAKNIEESNEISINNNKEIRDLFDYIGNRNTFNNENSRYIKYNNNKNNKNKRNNKILQFNDFYENSKNETSFIQSIKFDKDKNKKDLLLIFNIAIYLLYIFICFGELKILIFTFFYNFSLS